MNEKKIDFKTIVLITNKPGLYYIISQNTKGVSVRSLTDNTTFFVDGSRVQISLLSNIQVFGKKNNFMIGDILKEIIDKNYTYEIDAKDGSFIESFKNQFPELDYTQVHISDIKKIAKWAKILKEKNTEIISAES